jgi:hypothetical protein
MIGNGNVTGKFGGTVGRGGRRGDFIPHMKQCGSCRDREVARTRHHHGG